MKTKTYHLSEIKKRCEYVQFRYLLLLAKKIPAGSWIWFNGNQGQDYAILYNQVASSYKECVEELALNNNESIEAVEADYKDWYYKVPIEDVINSYENSISYYSPIKKLIKC